MRAVIRTVAARSFAAAVLASTVACSPPPADRPPPAAPPARAPSAAAASADEGRPICIGRSYTVTSAALKEARQINVYLPDSYADASRSFPVLYLLDGGVHEDFHHITGIVALEVLSKHMREVIVVGIEQKNRKHDDTYPTTDPTDRELIPNGGGSADFRSFIGAELQPYVQSHYRTSGEKAVIGESLAGLFIMETFLRQPDLFDDYIAISPSMWWDGGSLGKEAAARLGAFPPRRRALYLTIADEGRAMLRGVLDVVDALKMNRPPGLIWQYEPLPGETHGTIYEPAAQRALRSLFPPPPR